MLVIKQVRNMSQKNIIQLLLKIRIQLQTSKFHKQTVDLFCRKCIISSYYEKELNENVLYVPSNKNVY